METRYVIELGREGLDPVYLNRLGTYDELGFDTKAYIDAESANRICEEERSFHQHLTETTRKFTFRILPVNYSFHISLKEA